MAHQEKVRNIFFAILKKDMFVIKYLFIIGSQGSQDSTGSPKSNRNELVGNGQGMEATINFKRYVLFLIKCSNSIA